MIKITFYKRGGVYYGFHESGHAGYAESGDDIVCSAISAMTMLVINTVEVVYSSEIEYEIDDDSADIDVKALGALPESGEDENKQYAISGLMYSYYLQLVDLTEEYYEYLEVEEIEE